ncbi:TatD family hydrolase [Segatella copri]|uniref:TatD family hydrolase n=1 Tax=Segatella copri TaxID=165179 RepID=UPI002939F140|nr:TatD family hydrolase [Segatella copri]MDV3112021.1 TatD family hydrolase [Segatella copri]
MMRLYDTHFHLDLQKNVKAAIEEINANKIYTIAMTNLPVLYEKEKQQYDSPYIRTALGFHPELIGEYKKYIPLMWEKLSKACYIGEVGLDFTDKTYQADQVSFFSELVQRCRKDENKIISIHSRKAEREVLDVLDDAFSFKAILHWFSGDSNLLDRAVKMGCYFSVNGKMLKSRKIERMLEIVPKNRILLETDSPFGDTIKSHVESLKMLIDGFSPKYVMLAEEIEGILWNNFQNLLCGYENLK